MTTNLGGVPFAWNLESSECGASHHSGVEVNLFHKLTFDPTYVCVCVTHQYIANKISR